MLCERRCEKIQPDLLAERCVARDDRAVDPEPWHVVGGHLLRIRQGLTQETSQASEEGSLDE